MRTIRIKLYKFSELNKTSQALAIDHYRDINVDGSWWEGTFDDAKQIGLELKEFEFDSASFIRNLKGEFITSAGEVVEDILANHGDQCGTYKLAMRYKRSFQNTSDEVDEQQLSDTEDDFLNELLNEYKAMLQSEYEANQTDEAVADTIHINGYEFTADGSPANHIARKYAESNA